MKKINQDNFKKMYLTDLLTMLIMADLHWSWNDASDCIVDKDGAEIEWTDFGSIPLRNVVGFTQINFWGDGTIELQEVDGESINIYDYEIALIKKVIEALNMD